ncbi:hypothetical protein AWQ21_14820 (plasmid) [Picosynechococcus sp. PCC 7003]|uniref:hypothetical protein n=1 Tax=Picosynechococcus sp. PCC 7003 TaxID=374981 RepID=UPI000810D0D1|nr:hypothetical protein [Picosynechococcus sp. PCC 7003]ANV85802.1 hypothetical protein AWQ21_14820 [Picosynechococcus sp. PCC 7003]
MSSFALKSDSSCLSLSWESTCQLLQDVKQPHTRQRALDLLLQAHADDIAAMCRTTAWARQWGFEDAYQEAVTHFFETALRTDDPAELTSYWNLRNAVRREAARNLYPISVSPHFAQKLQSYSFSRDLDVLYLPHAHPPSFDELDWHFLQALCEPFLTKRQQSILTFICQIPGEVPSILELADYLRLSKASAQRAWNYFQKVFKVNVDLVQHLYRFINFDFLQAYFPQLTLTLDQCQQGKNTRKPLRQFLDFHSPLASFKRLALQYSQPLIDLGYLLASDFSSDFGLGFRTIYSRLSQGKFTFQLFKLNMLNGQLCFDFQDSPDFFMDQIGDLNHSKLPQMSFLKTLILIHLLLFLDRIHCRNFSLINLCQQFLVRCLTPLRRTRGSPLCLIS